MNDERRQDKPRNIRERSFDYALRAIKLYQFLQEGKDGAGWIRGKQYLRSATSIGANIEEGQSGQSKADFIHKMSIAQKEARESLYMVALARKIRNCSDKSYSLSLPRNRRTHRRHYHHYLQNKTIHNS